ncbi:retrovirus-related pol polyprotein from transposon TNT 1-94 [Tanacetum coccineum]|uniref:Retrovirus-related pol polyprotein from transposon TNT 1-94 n=1 Tax=Tanacetum coccineum TaxID=301880 RepID=A0ABQ5A4E0_9ASTR
MESSDPMDTPMVEKSKLDEDTQGKAVDPTHYRGMVGTLMYHIATYADADHAGCQDIRRSTSGCMQLLGDRLLAGIFTKALGRERIKFLINKLGMRSFTPETLKQLADEAEE